MPTNRLVHTVHVSGAIVDANTDLRQLEIPDPTHATIVKVIVDSMVNAGGAATLSIENAASGAGSGITVTFALGEYHQSNTGSLTTSGSFYLRSGTPNGLEDISVTIHYVPS